MYISYYIKKNLNILLNIYNINIYFGINSGGFWIGFENIHNLFFIY
jgi:hypothetical protein